MYSYLNEIMAPVGVTFANVTAYIAKDENTPATPATIDLSLFESYHSFDEFAAYTNRGETLQIIFTTDRPITDIYLAIPRVPRRASGFRMTI